MAGGLCFLQAFGEAAKHLLILGLFGGWNNGDKVLFNF